MLRARRLLVTTVLIHTACGSELRLEDGGGGAPSSVDATTTITGTTSAIATTSATGGFDVDAACAASCNHECVGGQLTCTTLCRDKWAEAKSWCGPEWSALFACQLRDCIRDNDCSAEEQAYVACKTIYCDDYTCTAAADSCSCAASSCDLGHTRRADCRYDQPGNTAVCDCYENEVLVTTCEESGGGCVSLSPSDNCCDYLLRNGYY